MDSRQIFVVTDRLRSKIGWLNPSIENGAWVFIGNDSEMMRDFIFNCIKEHFTENELYVSWTRTGSRKVSKKNIETSIDDILGKNDFLIWDTKFNRVIEFNKNGVMRLGVAKD